MENEKIVKFTERLPRITANTVPEEFKKTLHEYKLTSDNFVYLSYQAWYEKETIVSKGYDLTEEQFEQISRLEEIELILWDYYFTASHLDRMSRVFIPRAGTDRRSSGIR